MDGVENSKGHLEFEWHVHEYINEYIRFADSKAAAAIAFSSGLLAAMFSGKLHESFMSHSIGAWSRLDWLAMLAYAMLACSVLASVWAIRPRLWHSQRRAIIFWESVRGYGDRAGYWAALEKHTPSELAGDLAHHIFDLSSVAHHKYLWVAIGIWSAVAGGTLAALLMLWK